MYIYVYIYRAPKLYSQATAQLFHIVGQCEFATHGQQNIRLGTICTIFTMRKFQFACSRLKHILENPKNINS
jgi:hypothetical protein